MSAGEEPVAPVDPVETFRVGWWGIPFAAIFIFFGHNWARVLIMIVAVVSISTTFVAWAADEQAITLEGTFFSLGLDVLLLLALSSRSAAAYARRNERR